MREVINFKLPKKLNEAGCAQLAYAIIQQSVASIDIKRTNGNKRYSRVRQYQLIEEIYKKQLSFLMYGKLLHIVADVLEFDYLKMQTGLVKRLDRQFELANRLVC